MASKKNYEHGNGINVFLWIFFVLILFMLLFGSWRTYSYSYYIDRINTRLELLDGMKFREFDHDYGGSRISEGDRKEYYKHLCKFNKEYCTTTSG